MFNFSGFNCAFEDKRPNPLFTYFFLSLLNSICNASVEKGMDLMLNYWNPNFIFAIFFLSSVWDSLGSVSFEANDMLNFFPTKYF